MGERVFEGGKYFIEKVDVPASSGPSHSKMVIRHPGAVVILAFREDGAVVLIRNERVAVGASLLELPAGTLDEREAPLAAAHRELREETGFVAARMDPLLSFYPSPGVMDELMHVFVASELEPGPQALEPTERIEVVVTPLAEAISLVRDHSIRDGKTIATLLYWERFGMGR